MTEPLDDDDEPKKTPRATIIRRALVAALALACAGGWIYTRYLVKKGTLGEACTYDLHCRTEAPRCLKQSEEGEGVCSRPCDGDGDCATAIKCVKVELDDRDDRGRPLEGGYCFPQTLLDARRKKKTDGPSADRPKSDSWLDVPEAPSQLEGEIVLERGTAKSTWLVKGSLLAAVPAAPGPQRTIVDTSTLRVYAVDDAKRTFSASQLGATGEARVTKTDRKDRVAARECEIWQIEEGKAAREACVIVGAAFVDPAVRAATAWEKELAVRSAFPLRVVDPAAPEKPKLLVTKVDLHHVDAARFAIPKAYKNLAAH